MITSLRVVSQGPQWASGCDHIPCLMASSNFKLAVVHKPLSCFQILTFLNVSLFLTSRSRFKWLMGSGQTHWRSILFLKSTVPHNKTSHGSKLHPTVSGIMQSTTESRDVGGHFRILPTTVYKENTKTWHQNTWHQARILWHWLKIVYLGAGGSQDGRE